MLLELLVEETSCATAASAFLSVPFRSVSLLCSASSSSSLCLPFIPLLAALCICAMVAPFTYCLHSFSYVWLPFVPRAHTKHIPSLFLVVVELVSFVAVSSIPLLGAELDGFPLPHGVSPVCPYCESGPVPTLCGVLQGSTAAFLSFSFMFPSTPLLVAELDSLPLPDGVSTAGPYCESGPVPTPSGVQQGSMADFRLSPL